MSKQNDINSEVDRLVALLLSDEDLTDTQRDALFRWLDSEGNWDLWVDALDRHYKAHPRQEDSGTSNPVLVAGGWREVAERLGLDRNETPAKTQAKAQTPAITKAQTKTKTTALRRPRRRTTVFRIAAALLPVVLIVGGYIGWERQADKKKVNKMTASAFIPTIMVEPRADSVRRITLGDGTVVTLNRNATFAYNDGRECELRGEAYFKVAKNPERPFIIHSEHVTAMVFGTEIHFDTHGGDGSSRVALYDGSVELAHAAGTHLLDVPGQEFTLHHATCTHAVRDFDHTVRPDWIAVIEELFNFMTFGEIFDFVEAAYGVTIAGREKIDLTKELNFVPDKNLSISDMMSMLEFSHGGFSHSIDGDNIHIRDR